MSTERVAAMNSHTHLDTIRTYLKGCNTPDVDLMKSTLMPDMVHYFMGHEPVQGADSLADLVLQWNGDGRTTWTLDHGIVEGNEAVIEFTETHAFDDGRLPKVSRGSEWYSFRDGRIAEVRAYYHVVSGKPISELVNFPYAERGYTAFSDR